MNFLDIIIPQYKENDDVLKVLLDSINNQQRLNFSEIGIIIVNDGSDVHLSDSFLKSYKKLNIKYYINKDDVGSGPTIQSGIDRSKAKYVTFMDSDDFFYENSLYGIINLLKSANHNILCTTMLQENMKNGSLYFSKVTVNELRTLHGIFMKRKYLIENEIRFDPDLRHYEDTFFANILFCRNDYHVVNNISYVWKYNEGSETLKDKKLDFSVKYFNYMYDAYVKTYSYFCKYEIKNREIYIIQQIIELALILSSSFFEFEELKDKKEEYEKLVYELYINHINLFEALDKTKIDRIVNFQTKDVLSYYTGIKLRMSFYEFIEKMKQKY